LLPVQVLCAPLTPVAMVAPLPVVMVTLLPLTLLPSLCRGGGMLSSPPPTLPLLLHLFLPPLLSHAVARLIMVAHPANQSLLTLCYLTLARLDMKLTTASLRTAATSLLLLLVSS